MGLPIAVDFDGTCVTHMYPDVGEDIGAAPVLRKLVKAGGLIMLNTMRCASYLADAVEWFRVNEIPLYGINLNPTQHTWTTSPKVYAAIYIDDAALGCPLIYPKDERQRPYVDWAAVEKWFIDKGLILEDER